MIARLPSVIDSNGSIRKTSSIPMRRTRFTAEQVADAPTLARQLGELEKAVYDATLHARSDPAAKAIEFEGVLCGAGGAKVRIRHSLGHFVRWQVVDWAGSSTTAGPSLVCDRLDASPETSKDVLVLRSYVAGTATIRIYEVP